MAHDRVLLLHGIAVGPWSMRRLERAIAGVGYETLNLAYPSQTMPLAALADHVHARRGWIEGSGQLHVVGYSMGGLLARAYIAAQRPPNLGRVVMLGTPNTGSEVADLLQLNPLYRRFYGPAGAELTTTPSPALTRLLGTVDYPLGIIAGNRFLDPLGWLLIPGPNDGRVSVERAKLPGMADHITLPTTHTTMRWNRGAIEQTIHFLQHGRFRSTEHRPTSDASPDDPRQVR